MLSIRLNFLLIFIFLKWTYGARILGIFPISAKSHSQFTTAIMKSLISVGHEVVVVSPFSASIENFTVIDSSKTSFTYVSQSHNIQDLLQFDIYKRLKFINALEQNHCNNVMTRMEEIQDILKSPENQFDIMFVEILTMYECFLQLAEKLKIPVIGVVAQRSWLYADMAINNPNNPSFIPSTMRTYWKDDCFMERLSNTWNYLLKIFLKTFIIEHFDLAEKIPPSLIFSNSHHTMLPRPMNPNVVEIGGIHIQKEKPLTAKIEKFINESDQGVILVSFGSIAKGSTISENTLLALRQAFAEIPQRVIWKYEEQLENLPSNVMISDWIPQRDILAHEKVIAFVSHCGINGLHEAIYTETPIIAVPLFGDQPSNAAILEHLGVAFYLDINSFTKEDILRAVNAIVHNSTYSEKMKKLSKVFKDRPMTPQESVIYWTEYVIRHKGAHHMQPIRLHWFQYTLLDVTAFLILIFTILFYVSYKCIRKIY